MRAFADLSVRPKDPSALESIIRFASEKLEISLLGIEKGPLYERGLEISKEYDLDIICREVIRGISRRDVGRALARMRRGSDCIKVVEVKTLDIARYAAVKSGVDIIRMEPEAFKFIDKSEARLIREGGNKPIEISLRSVLKDPRSLPKLLNAIAKAFVYNIDIILVSDATEVFELVHPRSAAGIASLAGIPGDLALSYVSTVPFRAIAKIKP